jgi:hypothetical protein
MEMANSSASSRGGSSSSRNQSTAAFSYVYSGLTGAGMDSPTASKYALFCQHVYVYIQSNPDVQDALKKVKEAKDAKEVGEGAGKAYRAQRLLTNATQMGLTSAANGLRDVRAGGTAAVLSVFVDRFASYARAQGIELNECSLSVTKISLDFAGAMVGGATALSGWGLVLAGFSVLSMFDDSYELGKACLTSH